MGNCYAVIGSHLFHSNLSMLYHNVFLKICKAHGIGFNTKVNTLIWILCLYRNCLIHFLSDYRIHLQGIWTHPGLFRSSENCYVMWENTYESFCDAMKTFGGVEWSFCSPLLIFLFLSLRGCYFMVQLKSTLLLLAFQCQKLWVVSATSEHGFTPGLSWWWSTKNPT